MTVANLIGALEGPELLIILALVLVLFGGSKLPQLARSLGQAKKEFQEGMNPAANAPQATPEAAPTATPIEAKAEETVTISKAEYERLQQGGVPTPPTD